MSSTLHSPRLALSFSLCPPLCLLLLPSFSQSPDAPAAVSPSGQSAPPDYPSCRRGPRLVHQDHRNRPGTGASGASLCRRLLPCFPCLDGSLNGLGKFYSYNCVAQSLLPFSYSIIRGLPVTNTSTWVVPREHRHTTTYTRTHQNNCNTHTPCRGRPGELVWCVCVCLGCGEWMDGWMGGTRLTERGERSCATRGFPEKGTLPRHTTAPSPPCHVVLSRPPGAHSCSGQRHHQLPSQWQHTYYRYSSPTLLRSLHNQPTP